MPGKHLAPGVWSCPGCEAATPNHIHINDITTDRNLGTRELSLPEAGDIERSGVTLDAEDGLRGDGHQGAGRNPRKRKSKGRIVVASLNMRGGGFASGPVVANEKWLRINQLLRDNRIAVIGLQETHLSQERIDNLNELFNPSMVILGSPDPTNETGARGVAFAINTRIVNTEDLKISVVLPGRAAILSFRWSGERVAHVMNVYAPNAMSESETFWNDIVSKLRERRIRRPEIVMGDFNIVEANTDRLPPRCDQSGAVDALRSMLNELGVHDRWRTNNPKEKAFTYLQLATGSQSRIDRIYATDEIMRKAEDWEICGVGIPTDHRMVTVSLANYKTPRMGKGRWALPGAILNDSEFNKTMCKLGLEAQRQLENMGVRLASQNPQTIYHDFKTKLRDAARKRAKALIPKIDRKIDAIKDDIRQLLEAEEPDKLGVAILQERLTKLEVRRFDKKRRAVATKDWLQGETMTKYWTKLNAPRLPSTAIDELKTGINEDGSRRYTSALPEMAVTAMKHYDGLQTDADLDLDAHEHAVRDALEPMSVKLSTQQKGELAKLIKRCEVEGAIVEAPLGKAPGLDGIPAELWKMFLKWEKSAEDPENARTYPKISRIFQSVFNDIEKYGVIDPADFTKGWICPIYKLKKDRREVVNYRPITLLNADYKIMTRVLAKRLTCVATSLVHPDQAAFIPGRQIFGHIKLAKMVMEYAEAEECNGAIVALDQEKAYDMINHDYLWAVLRKLNFPENFIRTVKNLYEKAESCVMVNGTASPFYRIIRGVRQGDPMSCLLFVLAIEPLACALRKSGLKGLDLKNDMERLIAALFADDTTTYLSEHDSFTELQTILDKWCKGARARFNVGKTEVIPVGSERYRMELAERTTATRLGQTIPQTVRVARDGELVRILGSWIGNKCDEDVPWKTMIQKIEKNLLHWSRRNPTMVGRKLIVGMEVGSRTQFLARAHPMSDKIEKQLGTIVGDFMAKGEKRPRAGRETMCLPIERGGLNLLDIAARNEAIDVMCLKEYMSDSSTRQTWARVADLILAKKTAATSRNVDESAKVNAFLQTWKVSTQKKVRLGTGLARMVKVATKYNASIATINPSESFKEEMPIWYHIGELQGRSLANSLSAKCLRERHGVETVGQCVRAAARIIEQTPRRQGSSHSPNKNCGCHDCARDRERGGCDDPHRCATMAAKLVNRLGPLWKRTTDHRCDNLSLTPRRFQANLEADQVDEEIRFNPSVKDHAPIVTAFRIFGVDALNQRTRTAARRNVAERTPQEGIEVHTDGSCEGNGTENSIAAYGIWFEENDARNVGARVPGPEQSNQIAEIYAVEEAARRVNPNKPLHIVSDSRLVVDGFTKHLPTWEDKGWIGVKCAEFFKRAVAGLRARSAETTFRWVKGHDGNRGNEGADALAKAGLGMREEQLTDIPLEHKRFLQNGVRISVMTQSLAYKAIRQRKGGKERRTTQRIIARTQATLADDFEVFASQEKIWKSIRASDTARKIRDFTWKMAHGAHRVGEYWTNIPGYEQRAICSVCGVTESMEHILTECSAPGQKIIWNMVKYALACAGHGNLQISFGAIVGAQCVTLKTSDGSAKKGASRLARILIGEAAHMIWCLRCERVIQWDDPGKQHHDNKIRAKFWTAVNRRMLADRDLVWTRSKGRKPKRKVVEDTWRPILEGAENLPRDWVDAPRVLVGRMGQRPANGVG